MESSFRARLDTWTQALAIKIILLAAVFLVVPIIFYRLFQIADAQQTELLARTVEEKGTLVATLLRPHLERFQDESPVELQRALDDVATEDSNIKILVRPEGSDASSGFLYVMSAPAVSADYLAEERRRLIEIGVFDRLAPACEGRADPVVRFTNPAGQPEVLTSMTPVFIGRSCWVVITSQNTQALLDTSIGQPVWQTTTIHIAIAVYLLSAAIVAWLFLAIWRNIDRFRIVARKIRMHGAGETSFREMNTIPELAGVADDFDSLVGALKESRDFIVRTAEENAHALKAPLAVITQAIEPLKKATPVSNVQARRSLDLIERSAAKLDSLVSSARDIEQAAADVIYPVSRRINLSSYLAQLVAAYETTLTSEGKRLHSTIARDVYTYASEEAMESIIENLLENAASFTQPGGTVEVSLSGADGHADLTVADSGPGVAPERMPKIFERYYSDRSQMPERVNGRTALQGDQHYGLGLWIVRRNVEGLGGKISARNREVGGFAVTVSLATVD
jgi:two-component system, OmpR family, sensor histidine kinase ChvG